MPALHQRELWLDAWHLQAVLDAQVQSTGGAIAHQGHVRDLQARAAGKRGLPVLLHTGALPLLSSCPGFICIHLCKFGVSLAQTLQCRFIKHAAPILTDSLLFLHDRHDICADVCVLWHQTRSDKERQL